MNTSTVSLSFDDRHSDSVYVEAKQEYTLQLLSLMEKHLYRLFEKEYQSAKHEVDESDILEYYQQKLMNIQDWNQSKIDTLFEKFLRNENCPWFEQLLGAIFVANIRVLSTIRTRQPKETLQVEVPKGNYFFHRALVEIARELYRRPYLFYQIENDDDLEEDKAAEILKLIHRGIEKAIRNLLPVQQLMNAYLPFNGGFSSNSTAQSTPAAQQPTQEIENLNDILDKLPPLPSSDESSTDESSTDDESNSDYSSDDDGDSSLSEDDTPISGEKPNDIQPIFEEQPPTPKEQSPTPQEDTPVMPEEVPVVMPEEVPVVMPEEVPVVMPEEAPAVMTEEAPAVMTEEAPAVMTEEAPAVMTEEAPAVMTEEIPQERPLKEIHLDELSMKNPKYRILSKRMTDHSRQANSSQVYRANSGNFFGEENEDNGQSFFERG